MYYEEKVINGKTVYRTSPGGIWIDRSNKQLTAELSSLRQENERLRGALKPFADACDPRECKEEGNRDDWDAWEQPEAMNVKIGDFKRARQALTKEG